MAHALQIDTLAFVKRLREAGADEGLAEAIVEGITAADTSELATKADVAQQGLALKSEIAQVESSLKAEIAQVEGSLKGEIAQVRTEIATSKAETLKWMFGAIAAQTGIIIAVVKFL